MSEYDFTLILTGITDFDETTVDRLFEAGCDDSTVAKRSGRVYITFSREAESLTDAVFSAIDDVNRSGIGAKVLRVDDCNLITQAEVARRLGRTRQNIEQYAKGSRGRGGFPAPACNLTEGVPLYYWCEVAYWANKTGMLTDEANKNAQAIATLNMILELEHQKEIVPELARQMLQQFSLCNEPTELPAPTDCDC